MSRESFPVFPKVGDYIRFKAAFTIPSEKDTIVNIGDVGVVLVTELNNLGKSKAYEMDVGLKNGKVYGFNFTDIVNYLEVIQINSPAYKVLYGQNDTE
jgi:hypothetical protein